MKLIINFANKEQVGRLVEHLQNLSNELYDITIKKHKRKRSIEQNSYYWSCVIAPLANHFGYTSEEMHEELKLLFNRCVRESKVTGKVLEYGGSTTDFNTTEMEIYLDKIRIWALTEHDFKIMLPNEHEEELNEK